MTRMDISSLIHPESFTSPSDPPASSNCNSLLRKRSPLLQRRECLISKTLKSPRNIVPMHAFYLRRLSYESSSHSHLSLKRFPTSPISPTSSSSTDSMTISRPWDDVDFTVSHDNVHAASRLIGQKHREKEMEALEDLKTQVDILCEQNRFLLLSKQQAETSMNISEAGLKKSSGHRISDRAAATLGAYNCSGAAALVLLETIAMRRNLVWVGHRSRVLECPPETAFAEMLNAAQKNLISSSSFSITSQPPFIHGVYNWVLNAHENWSRTEDSTKATITSYPSRVRLSISGITSNIESDESKCDLEYS